MSTSQRIDSFIKYLSISYNKFDQSIDASNGYIGKIIKTNGSIGSDKLEKIASTYTDLNLHWLITGKGRMLFDDDEIALNAEEPEVAYKKPGKSSAELNRLKSVVSKLEKELTHRDAHIQKLKDETISIQSKLIEALGGKK